MDKFRVTFDLWAESQDDALLMIQRMAQAAGEGDKRGNYDTFTLSDKHGGHIASGGSWASSADLTIDP